MPGVSFRSRWSRTYGWANTKVAWTFSLAICFLGLSAAWGGTQLPRLGPRRLAVAGGLLFGLGYLLAALALLWKSLTLLYLGYGVIGGIGLGLGYVTPVATVARWFPDKKGLVTGMVIMGFGFGALLMSKLVAPWLLSVSGGNLVAVFAWLGIGFMAATTAVGLFLCNPPEGYHPPGYTAAGAVTGDASGTPSPNAIQAILSPAFAMMWLVFFCNILAGISIISFQSPMFQSLWRSIDPELSAATLASYGASLIAFSSVLNGVGRMFWGGISDRIGRVQTFRIMLATQVVAFGLLMIVHDPWVFVALICYVLLCYGGGFGTMPSFVLDVFGKRLMAVVYGTILTAWSAAGIVGPQLVALLTDRYPAQASTWSFAGAAVFLVLGLVLSLFLRSGSADPQPAR